MGGIVLAGGQSRRMGVDKALLPYEGATLLAHMVSLASAAGKAGPVVVVVDRVERMEGIQLPGRPRIIADLYPGAGPLGGIVTGLRAFERFATEGYHLVVACDMPRLLPSLIHLLLDSARGFDGAIPEIGGRLEPLCALYDRRCADKLEKELLSGNLAVYKAVQSLNLNRIDERRLRSVDPGLVSFMNLNTPEDYSGAVNRTDERTDAR